MTARLYDVAHCRAGDKGNVLTLVVMPYDAADYPRLVRDLTAEAVGRQVAGRVVGSVVRHEMPGLPALVFVCERAPDDTVTTSLYRDAHGKTLSSVLLDLPL